MKKSNLLKGIAAMTLGLAAVGCSHEDTYNSLEALKAQIVAEYNAMFVKTFGQPASNQDWGFGTSGTRSITVNGDVYNKFPSKEDVADKFPTSVPSDADEVSELLSKYQDGSKGIWDLYAIYKDVIKEGHNLKITQTGEFELGGSYQNAGWDGSANMSVAYPYNVYVNVDGNVTLKRNGATHFNLYILKGTVTLGADYGEQAGLISVAEGATLNDKRNSVAANQGVQIYNRGTINATNTEKYDIGNFCTVYNEGTFKVSGALTYSPGDANTSYFVNFGDDAVLTAASMTLNSSGNFFNDGTATITGETNVTQAGIYWVNAGHYTTGSMVFSAKNATFYNYCQLLVKGNAHMYDGEFNLMTNSYTEASTADFNNFIVNMESNSGFNVNGNTTWGAQGDGTYQGFKTDGSNVYVRLGGTTTVAGHLHSLELTGNITYAIKEIEDLGAGDSGVQPTYLFNEGTIEVPFAELTVTPNENGCGATWSRGTTTTTPEPNPTTPEPNWEFKARVFAEDLSVNDESDFDFNDVVFDVYHSTTTDQTKIQLLAAGGTLPIRVAGFDVHELFGEAETTMINTGVVPGYKIENNKTAKPIILDKKVAVKDIAIVVSKDNTLLTLDATEGKPAAKFAVEAQIKWCPERSNIEDVYPDFGTWVKKPSTTWYTEEDYGDDVK